MTFTVLGASGFVGSHLVSSLKAAGQSVIAPQRDESDFLTQDLGHVFYCIGLTADFRSRPFATIEAHVSVLNKFLQTARFQSLTYLSTTRVYMGGEHGLEAGPVMVQPQNPSDLYNISKLAGESICFSSGRENVRAVRLSNVVGLDTSSSNFVFDIARDAIKGHVKLNTNPSSAKDYIGINDVVALLPLIAQNGKEKLYNVASGRQIAHKEWLDQLVSLTGCTYEAQAGGTLVQFPDVNIELIKNEFGYSPENVMKYLPAILDMLRKQNN
jgi:nucleoside-diphosphate-sugar epimerase